MKLKISRILLAVYTVCSYSVVVASVRNFEA